MISRHLIRVKAFEVLYSKVSTNNFNVQQAQKEFVVSLEKTNELYFMALLLPYWLTKFSREKLDNFSRMFRPSQEQIDLNLKFQENPISLALGAEKEFLDYCSSHGVSWSDFNEQLRSFYNYILESESFKQYASKEEISSKDVLKLFEDIYLNLLFEQNVLLDSLEDASIWWGDSVDFVFNAAISKFRYLLQSGKVDLSDVLDSEQEKTNQQFGENLIAAVLTNYDEYAEMAQAESHNWDLDRVVMSDLLAIVMGIAEGIRFSDIGLRVTLNEYVELIKHFSTPKSQAYLNGVLNKVLKELQESGKIIKGPKGISGALK